MTDSQPTNDKQPRFRSPPYPAVPLNKAIDRASSLYTKALHHSVPLSVLASAWDYGEKSSGLFATTAALIHFGLLSAEGSGEKRRFKLTDGAMRIIRDPDPKSEKRQAAIRGAALAPKIHAALWEKYGAAGASGSMDVVLKSYLTLDRSEDGSAPYSDVAADDLIAEYRATIMFAGLLDSGGVSSDIKDVAGSGNLVDEEETPPMNPSPNLNAAPPVQQRMQPPPAGAGNVKSLKFTDGERELTTGLLAKDASFRLIVTGKIGAKEIDRLIAKLQLDKEILAEPDDDAISARSAMDDYIADQHQKD